MQMYLLNPFNKIYVYSLILSCALIHLIRIIWKFYSLPSMVSLVFSILSQRNGPLNPLLTLKMISKSPRRDFRNLWHVLLLHMYIGVRWEAPNSRFTSSARSRYEIEGVSSTIFLIPRANRPFIIVFGTLILGGNPAVCLCRL